jgi:hypothetical protein
LIFFVTDPSEPLYEHTSIMKNCTILYVVSWQSLRVLKTHHHRNSRHDQQQDRQTDKPRGKPMLQTDYTHAAHDIMRALSPTRGTTHDAHSIAWSLHPCHRSPLLPPHSPQHLSLNTGRLSLRPHRASRVQDVGCTKGQRTSDGPWRARRRATKIELRLDTPRGALRRRHRACA